MAYNIKQFRGAYGESGYIESASFQSSGTINYTFFNQSSPQKTFSCSDSRSDSLSPNTPYYLNFSVNNTNTMSMDIKINLRETDTTSSNTKQLYFPTNILNVPAGTETNPGILTTETIFSQKNTFKYIDFVVNRDIQNWGKQITPTINSLYKILNLVQTMTGGNPIKKIGVRTNPGFSMVINNEWIRVGPSGIYQMNNDIDITFLGFFPKEGERFVVDYEY